MMDLYLITDLESLPNFGYPGVGRYTHFLQHSLDDGEDDDDDDDADDDDDDDDVVPSPFMPRCPCVTLTNISERLSETAVA